MKCNLLENRRHFSLLEKTLSKSRRTGRGTGWGGGAGSGPGWGGGAGGFFHKDVLLGFFNYYYTGENINVITLNILYWHVYNVYILCKCLIQCFRGVKYWTSECPPDIWTKTRNKRLRQWWKCKESPDYKCTVQKNEVYMNNLNYN